VELAEHWLAHNPSPERRVVATRILAAAMAKSYVPAIRSLLETRGRARIALELAREYPAAGLADALGKHLGDGSRQALALSALGRVGTEHATKLLATRLDDPQLGLEALLALAQSSYEQATEEFERRLSQKGAESNSALLRAAVVHQYRTRVEVEGLRLLLDAASRAAAPERRELGIWGLSALSPEHADTFVSDEKVPSQALAPLVLVHGEAFATRLAERLEKAKGAAERLALAPTLLFAAAREKVSTLTLLELLADGGAPMALGAFGLASRDPEAQRPRTVALLGSSDAHIRAHAALGLGLSPNTDASGLLVSRYFEERSEIVRWALVIALSHRRDADSKRTLRLAHDLDPSNRVRGAAAAGLRGQAVSPTTLGADSAWLVLSPPKSDSTPPKAALGELPLPIVFQVGGLLDVPFVPQQDGTLVLLGLPHVEGASWLGRPPRSGSTEQFETRAGSKAKAKPTSPSRNPIP
jgi:hypothetical protein